MPKKKVEICVRSVLAEMNTELSKSYISRIGENVREAWDMIPGTKTPKKKVYEGGEPANMYPEDFRPIIVNCITQYIKKHGTTQPN